MLAEIYRAQMNKSEFMVVHRIADIKPKLFISPGIVQRRATVTAEMLNEKTVENPGKPVKKTVSLIYSDSEEEHLHTAMICKDKTYLKIDAPLQVAEMMGGQDPSAKALAYDLLRIHEYEILDPLIKI